MDDLLLGVHYLPVQIKIFKSDPNVDGKKTQERLVFFGIATAILNVEQINLFRTSGKRANIIVSNEPAGPFIQGFVYFFDYFRFNQINWIYAEVAQACVTACGRNDLQSAHLVSGCGETALAEINVILSPKMRYDLRQNSFGQILDGSLLK